MKRIGIFTLLLMFALLAGTAVAETANKDLPTQDELNGFLDSAKTTDAVELSELALKEHPAWKWDLWKCSKGNVISFYFKCKTKAGYGSVYKGVSCGSGLDLVKSYTGEDVQQESNVTENKTQENYTTSNETPLKDTVRTMMVDGAKEEVKHTFEQLEEDIKGYGSSDIGKLYTDLKNKGWDINIIVKTDNGKEYKLAF